MKDFFDLSVLLHDQAINDEELLRAIEATFLRRATPLPDALPVGLSDAFAGDATKQTQWRAFLRRNQLQARELAEVVAGIRSRVMRLGVGTP